jgi:hypothetical protein
MQNCASPNINLTILLCIVEINVADIGKNKATATLIDFGVMVRAVANGHPADDRSLGFALSKQLSGHNDQKKANDKQFTHTLSFVKEQRNSDAPCIRLFPLKSRNFFLTFNGKA